MSSESQSEHKTARYIAYIGLFPFIVVLFLLLVTNNSELITHSYSAIITYAALILAFIGAIHWGISLTIENEEQPHLYIISIVPTMLAFISLLVPTQHALGILFFSFLALHQYEKNFLWEQYFPEWFQLIRSRLSFSVSGILLIIWITSLN